MDVTIGGHSFRYPNDPTDLKLGEWIDFVKDTGAQLDSMADQLDQLPPGPTKHLSAMKLYSDRAYAVVAWWAGMDQEEAKQAFPAREVFRLYREEHSRCFTATPLQPVEWEGATLELPPSQLHQGSTMTFGEIVDSKAMQQNAKQLAWSKWELIQRICAIFLRPAEAPYLESYAYLDGTRSQEMATLPIGHALMVSLWFEELNNFLEAFTVFQESSTKSGAFMRKHLDHWGWVNFLKSIAKTKVFDIPGSGLNSVQCARSSKGFDVLMYASEEKEYSEAMEADYQSKNQGK